MHPGAAISCRFQPLRVTPKLSPKVTRSEDLAEPRLITAKRHWWKIAAFLGSLLLYAALQPQHALASSAPAGSSGSWLKGKHSGPAH